MKRFICLLFCCLSVLVPASDVIYVSGRGTTREAAVLDALMRGVSRKNKTFVSNQEIVNNDNYSGSQSSNSFGHISGFEVVEFKQFDGEMQVKLAVSFQGEKREVGSNSLSTQEIWNLAQQLKYFNSALEHISEIFKDNPLYAVQKKYSFQPIQDNTEEILLEQELDIYMDKTLYQAQVEHFAALLGIYSKGQRVFSYPYFQKNCNKIIEQDKNAKKIYITDAKLHKTVEYTVRDQFFERIGHVLNDRDSYCYFICRNSKNQEVLNYRKWLKNFDMRYHIQQGNAIMLFPFFRNKANSISEGFTIKYKRRQIKNLDKCNVIYPIVVNKYKKAAMLLTINIGGSKTVEATGVGETASDAEKDALKEALISVCGSAVSSKTVIKNDDVESEKIISKSRGIIQKYDVIKSEQKRGGFFCTVKAEVNMDKLVVIDRGERNFSIDFSRANKLLDKNVFHYENGKLAAAELRKLIYQTLATRLVGKVEMGKEARINGDRVHGLKCKIRLFTDFRRYNGLINKLTPFLEQSAVASYKLNLYGQKDNITKAFKSNPLYMPSATRKRDNTPRQKWNLAVVQLNSNFRPNSIVFYRMADKFVAGFNEFRLQQKKKRGNWVASKDFDEDNFIFMYMNLFNNKNKLVNQHSCTIRNAMPAAVNSKIWTPYIRNNKNFIEISFDISAYLVDLNDGDLSCITDVIHGYREPKYDDFSVSDFDNFSYNDLIDRKSPLYGHEWYYLQEVLKRRGTMYNPVSEYAVYYSHVADNIPLGEDWKNGGLGFVPSIKMQNGAFEVLTMSPYSTVMQGEKVYSFNDKTFSDIKELFAWLKEIPAGEKIVVKTGSGDKTIVLPPRNMEQDYWQKQLQPGQPIVPPLAKKVYNGFVDQAGRELFAQKKYVEAWNETKNKKTADVELLGQLAGVFYYNYDEFKKAIESKRDPNMKYMSSLSGDDEMDEINPIPKAELAKKRGSAVGAYLYAIICFNRDGRRQFTSKDYTNSTFRRNLYEAAKMGSADATNHLACLYVDGTVVTRHYNYALSIFKKAAESYHALAELNIGRFYLYGWGDFKMKINKFKAEYWLRRSAEHGNQDAAELLKTL